MTDTEILDALTRALNYADSHIDTWPADDHPARAAASRQYHGRFIAEARRLLARRNTTTTEGPTNAPRGHLDTDRPARATGTAPRVQTAEAGPVTLHPAPTAGTGGAPEAAEHRGRQPDAEGAYRRVDPGVAQPRRRRVGLPADCGGDCCQPAPDPAEAARYGRHAAARNRSWVATTEMTAALMGVLSDQRVSGRPPGKHRAKGPITSHRLGGRIFYFLPGYRRP
ncbi:hypothetical protein DS6A_82 [Mycobacterium phage DS6A]|uniref:Uncharacterized protein n=1 Tax=Mycobacterium phage DS6A TaxID=45764 RepID=G8I4J2_9CAUD|nr:hypothetical protein DS6A_82 [Mycobacterium phage DS6A]AER47636.1 hypothetical protein DS6A_82 [Mycobacterium phage DS6A]